MTLPLRQRLINYLEKQTGWVASGELQRLVASRTTYTPRTAVRRLEEMAEKGELEVKYVKGHAHYKFKESRDKYWADRIREFDNYQPSEKSPATA